MDGVMGVMSERFPPANHRGFARKPMFGLVQGSGLVRGRGGAGLFSIERREVLVL